MIRIIPGQTVSVTHREHSLKLSGVIKMIKSVEIIREFRVEITMGTIY